MIGATEGGEAETGDRATDDPSEPDDRPVPADERPQETGEAIGDATVREIGVFWLRYVLLLPVASFGFLALLGSSWPRALTASAGILLFSIGGSLGWFWLSTAWTDRRSPLLRGAIVLVVIGIALIALATTIRPLAERIEHKTGQSPQDVTLDDGVGWIPDPIDQTITGISIDGGDVTAFGLPNVFEAIADGGRLFASTSDDSIVEVDTRSGAVIRTIDLAEQVGCMTILDGELWATVPRAGRVVAIDLDTFETDVVPLDGTPASLAPSEADGRIWVTDIANRVVVGIDAANRQEVARYETASEPVGIWADDTTVWVGNADSNLVTTIDVDRGSRRNLPVPARPTDLEVRDGVLWVLSQTDAVLTALDAASGEVLRSVDIGGAPIKLDIGQDYVWVANQGAGSLVRILR